MACCAGLHGLFLMGQTHIRGVGDASEPEGVPDGVDLRA